MNLPFDPVKKAQKLEEIVTQDLNRRYHRFRAAPYYGGIATADAVGCCFLCAYCWSYFRILKPEKEGRFYSPQNVADKLLNIMTMKRYRLCRITGCEPILGEQSLKHLINVVKILLGKNTDLKFVLETNGFMLGYRSDFINSLKIPRLSIRVAIKGWDEPSFESITGASRKYFNYPLLGLKYMLDEKMDVWPAVMWDTFGKAGFEKLNSKLIDMGIKCEIETEYLERYPYVMENIRKRGVNVR